MTRRIAVAALALLAVVGCRQRSAGRHSVMPQLAIAPLTEDDIALLATVAPALQQLTDTVEIRDPVRVNDNLGIIVTKNVDWVESIPGVDSVLAAHGADWPAVRGAAFRVIAAIFAQGFDGARLNEDGLKYERIGVKMAARKRYAEGKKTAKVVPEPNQEIVSRHQRDLRAALAVFCRAGSR